MSDKTLKHSRAGSSAALLEALQADTRRGKITSHPRASLIALQFSAGPANADSLGALRD